MVKGQVPFSHYAKQAAEAAVRLANTFDIVSGVDALQTPPDLARFIQRELVTSGDLRLELTDRDVRRARALRARIRSVWDARDGQEVARAIDSILRSVAARPRVTADAGGGPHLAFESASDDPVKQLGAFLAMGLSVVLLEGGPDRFGTCSSARCHDVYVDASKNRSRRFCSDTCTTREGVAAYRVRRRTAVR